MSRRRLGAEMGPASSREQIVEQLGDDDGLQIRAKPAIVANNIVRIKKDVKFLNSSAIPLKFQVKYIFIYFKYVQVDFFKINIYS